MKAISLFSGIGGDTLAAQWAGFETIQFVEWDKFCQAVLRKHWPDIPIYGDIDEFDARPFRGTIVLIYGGDPCQPNSIAGKRKGKADDRYKWPQMLRVICEVKPTWVVSENPTGRLTMDFHEVLSDLEGQGYETRSFVIPACAVNAPHRRDRLYIVAYSGQLQRLRAEGQGIYGENKTRREARTSNKQTDAPNAPGIGKRKSADKVKPVSGGGAARQGTGGSDRFTPDADDRRQPELQRGIEEGRRRSANSPRPIVANAICQRLEIGLEPAIRRGTLREEGTPSSQAHLYEPHWNENWIEAATALCGVDDGFSNRVARLKALGNAQVPQQVYQIYKAIADIQKGEVIDD